MVRYLVIGLVLFGVAVLYLYTGYLRRKENEGEGFADSVDLPKIVPGGSDDRSIFAPGIAFDPSTELLLQSTKLPAMNMEESRSNYGKMTSQQCYTSDMGEPLKQTRNFLQRTNNYVRSHPDDCSAPNHELIGTFYSPFDGVGRTPEKGTSVPISATCLR